MSHLVLSRITMDRMETPGQVRIRSRTSDGFASAWTDALVITVSPGEVFETDDMEPNLEAEDPEVVAEVSEL